MLVVELGPMDQGEKEDNFKDIKRCYNLSEQSLEKGKKGGLKD